MFDRPEEVDSTTYQMKMADFVRAKDRARINNLFNGAPPYSQTEVEENGIAVNVNHLEGTSLAHEARTQFYQAFLKPGNYFTLSTDMGPVHKRNGWGRVVTKEMNKIMKRSLVYFECFRSKFASDVLHGIGPAAFRNSERWCPQMIGVEDILIPAMTLLTMENLPFFAIYRSYTAPELIRLTKGEVVDEGWNMEMVDACLEWVDEQSSALLGSNWPEIWSPEKSAERVKGDGGFYSGDQVPTINTWDFYFWSDKGKETGWRRRVILDSWSMPTGRTGESTFATRKKGKVNDLAQRNFLYNGKNRIYGRSINEIVNFQFADLSAVSPFRYHSVRSLGYLLYSVCHLQNRLRCKFSEAVFEALMMYFRVKDIDDAQRALKVNLISRGFIDDTIQFVPPEQRWQVNAELVKLGLNENASVIAKNSASYITSPQAPPDKREKTKFEVMAEVNAMTSLVSAGLMQAYAYQTFEYREIHRRFMIRNSSDPDVRTFQANCMRQGVPLKHLNSDCWEVEPERVMGAGNKTLELAIAQQLMEYRALYDPEPQRQILRDVTMAITDDPARSEALVPDQPQISDSIHDAQLAAGSLMQGLPVAIKSGINRTEYIEALLTDMAVVIRGIQASGNVGTMEKIMGLQNIAQHIAENLALLDQDKQSKQAVRQYGDQLRELMNLVRAFQQRLAEQMKQQAQNGSAPGQDMEAAKEAQRLAAQQAMAQAKVENTKTSHAQRTAQRQVQFEMEQRRKQEEFQQRMRQEQVQFQQELAMEQMKSGVQARMDDELNRAALGLERERGLSQLEIERMRGETQIELERRKAEAKAAESDTDEE